MTVPALPDVPRSSLHPFLVDWVKLWAADFDQHDFLLEPLLARGRSHAIVGSGKAGKSMLALACAAALATGRQFLHRPAGDPVSVAYIDLEMTEADVFERLETFGYGPDDDLGNLHYLLHPLLPPLDTPEGGAEVLQFCRDVGAAVVWFDTYARVLAGSEQESDSTIAFDRYTGGPLKGAGVTWVRLDHEGKDAAKGARGSSAKNDDVDVVWQLRPAEGGVALRATHRRVAWVPETVALALTGEPLTYRATAKVWPPGTETAAAVLDELEVPLDASRRLAAQMLTDADRGMRTEILGAALKWRKDQR